METKTILIIFFSVILLVGVVLILIYILPNNSEQNSCELYKLDGELAYRHLGMEQIILGLKPGTVQQASQNLLATYEKYDNSEINELLDEMESCKENVYSATCLPVVNIMREKVHSLAAKRYLNEVPCNESYAEYKKDGKLYMALTEKAVSNLTQSVFSDKETAIAEVLESYDNSAITDRTQLYRTCYEKDKTNQSCYMFIQQALYRAYDEMKERY